MWKWLMLRLGRWTMFPGGIIVKAPWPKGPIIEELNSVQPVSPELVSKFMSIYGPII